MARVLLLAGTGHARRLAADLIAAQHDVTASLAGATAQPAPYPCPLRHGGFGGANGLARYITNHRIEALIDATHPFAAQISANARQAAAATHVPLLRLARPPWTPEPGENWIDVPDLAAAAATLPTDARAFLATGRGSLPTFATRPDIWLALRQIDKPDQPFPGQGKFVIARPPFTADAEEELLTSLSITHLVTKNAGGAASRTKLTAAARLNLPVIMVQRPKEPPQNTFTTPEILAHLHPSLFSKYPL